MKELKDIVLKKGDMIYFNDGNHIPVAGWVETVASKIDYPFKITKIERPKYETIYEAPKQILDEEEKEYLEAVCGPFKDRVIFISKKKAYREEAKLQYLQIGIKEYNKTTDYIFMPSFKADTMYIGMELDKEYALKELGLFE